MLQDELLYTNFITLFFTFLYELNSYLQVRHDLKMYKSDYITFVWLPILCRRLNILCPAWPNNLNIFLHPYPLFFICSEEVLDCMVKDLVKRAIYYSQGKSVDLWPSECNQSVTHAKWHKDIRPSFRLSLRMYIYFKHTIYKSWRI